LLILGITNNYTNAKSPFASLVERTAFLYALFRYPSLGGLYRDHYSSLISALKQDLHVIPFISSDKLWTTSSKKIRDSDGTSYDVTKYAICYEYGR
jgi:hypothetical protein